MQKSTTPAVALDYLNAERPLPFMCRSVHGFRWHCRALSRDRLTALDVTGWPALYVEIHREELRWKAERPHQQDGGGIER